jgi:hypothetical protein
MQDVGKPFKIRVGHDGKGMGAGWHLNKIVLVNQRTKEVTEVCAFQSYLTGV